MKHLHTAVVNAGCQ